MFGVYYLAISTFGTAMTDWVNDNLFGDGWELFGAAMPSVPALFEGWLSAAGASDMVISWCAMASSPAWAPFWALFPRCSCSLYCSPS